MKLFKYSLTILMIFFLYFDLKLEAKTYEFIFSKGNENWQGDFTDYPVGQEFFFELAWGWQNLPKVISVDGKTLSKGMFLSGDNHSDDLFMFIRRQIGDLKPNTCYELTFSVIVENNVYPGQSGIGGSPGESVYFKVGASTKKPHRVNKDGFYLLNVDKGNQSQGGKNAIVVGDMANANVPVPPNPLITPPFEPFPSPFTNQGNPLKVKTDDKGRLWLFVGTDSGFEGPTLYYIAKISVKAKKSESRKCK